jgi:elongation factor P
VTAREIRPSPISTSRRHINGNVPKDATLSNGAEVQVPQYVEQGDTVRIDVETGKFVERLR